MEVEVRGAGGRGVALLLTLAVVTAFAVAGRFVTPVRAGRAQVLTPDRWSAWKLERRTRREARAMQENAARLRALLEEGRPSPVEAMLLARRIYARHRTGTPTTGPARDALVMAAEAVSRYATGTASRREAVEALNRAIALIRELNAQRKGKKRQHIPFIRVNAG